MTFMVNRSYEKILIDSNILVYSMNTASSKCEQAKTFIKKTPLNFIPIIADQNIFETLRVITHPKFQKTLSSKKAITRFEKVISSFIRIFPSVETKKVALNFIKQKNLSSNKIFDAYLVATMISNGIRVIATDNVKDFKVYEQIKVINPFK